MKLLNINTVFYRRFFHFTLLLILLGICYSNTLQNEWHFDDYSNIVDNRNVHLTEFSRDALQGSFYSYQGTGKLSRPVAFMSFGLNHYFSGLDTTGYHLINITIHILCAFMVYLVFVWTLRLCHNDEEDSAFISITDIALLGAVLWSLHPIQTQAVTYIVQRMASLACLFYMTAMYCFLRFRTGEKTSTRLLFLVFGCIFYIAGVFTKENAALLPLALVAYELAFFHVSRRQARTVLLLPAVFLLISLFVLFAMFGDSLSFFQEAYTMRPFTMWERLITEPIILWRYLFLVLVPVNDFLTLESDIFASRGLLDPPLTLVANLGVVFLVVFGIIFLRRLPLLCFAILFYFINHLVESSFIGLELYFEHRNYLPSIFLYLAVSYYGVRLVLYYSDKGRLFMQGLLVTALTLVLISLGNATYLRNDIWQDDITLLKDSIEKSPQNMRAYVSLAAVYIEQEKYNMARLSLQQAEKLYKAKPDRFQDSLAGLLYYNSGVAYAKLSVNRKAIKAFHKSIEYDDIQWETYYYLGLLYFEAGDLHNAVKAVLNAIKLEGSRPETYNLMGLILFADSRSDLAIEAFEKGIEISLLKVLRQNLIAAYIQKGELRRAQREFYKLHSDSRDQVYLLYRAYLFPGEERTRALNRLASLLFTSGTDYCEWISEIRRNRSPGIIYPDITAFEEELGKAYTALHEETRAKFAAAMEQARACSLEYPAPEAVQE